MDISTCIFLHVAQFYCTRVFNIRIHFHSFNCDSYKITSITGKNKIKVAVAVTHENSNE